jgi:hypothetical protein
MDIALNIHPMEFFCLILINFWGIDYNLSYNKICKQRPRLPGFTTG